MSESIENMEELLDMAALEKHRKEEKKGRSSGYSSRSSTAASSSR